MYNKKKLKLHLHEKPIKFYHITLCNLAFKSEFYQLSLSYASFQKSIMLSFDQIEAIYSPLMFMFLGFVLSNVSLTPLLYGVYGALAIFYLVRRVNEVKEQTFVEGCLVRIKEENEKLLKENEKLLNENKELLKENEKFLKENEKLLKENEKFLKENEKFLKENKELKYLLVKTEDKRAWAVQKNALLCHKLSSARQERDNALNDYALLEVKNQRLRNRCSYWVQDAANTQRQLDNVKQQLVDERRENLSNSLYVNFLKGELLELRIAYHEASDLRKTVEELTQNVYTSEILVYRVDSILRDMIRTHQDDNEFCSFYNTLVEIRESIETYFYSVYQPTETEDE